MSSMKSGKTNWKDHTKDGVKIFEGKEEIVLKATEETKSQSTTSITKEVEGALRIDHDALRKLLIRPKIYDKPIAIISVTGSMRNGKSYLLNFFVRYFREKGWKNRDWINKESEDAASGTFRWKGGTERCTTGIHLLNEHFEVPMVNGRTMIVLLMDTQGLFDHKTPETVNKTLLTLGTMASSVQIFNVKENINSHNLQYLKTCVDFALATGKAEKAGAYLKLQRLMFLVRDYPFDGDAGDFLKIGQTYLEGILGSDEGGDELVKVRKGIRTSFEDVRGFAMPHPGLKVTKSKFDGRNSEVGEDFLCAVKIFVEETAKPEQLVPKSSKKGDFLNARQLLNMLTACDDIFAQHLYEAANVMEANEKAYYAAAYEEAIAEYRKVLKERVDGDEKANETDLKNMHLETKRHAMNRFNSISPLGNRDYEENFRNHLEKQCDEYFKLEEDYLRAKRRVEEMGMQRKTQKAFLEYEREMQRYLFCSPKELEERHKKCFEKISKKYGKSANLGELNEEVNQHYQDLRESNQKHHEEAMAIKKEERKQKLHKLAVTVRRETAKEWNKVLENLLDDDEMKDADKRINEEISELYWKEALTEVECKYKRILDMEMSRVFDENMPGYEAKSTPSRTPSDTKSNQLPESESSYHERVQEITERFASRLTEIKNERTPQRTLKEEADDIFHTHRTLYLSSCSEDILTYYKLLKNDMEDEYKRAMRRNEENWKHFMNEMESTFDVIVLELEKGLEQEMDEIHLNEEELLNWFGEAEKKVTKERQGALEEVLSTSKSAMAAFAKRLKERMEELQDKVIKKNKGNIASRVVMDCKVPEKPGFFKRIWIRAKSVLRLEDVKD